MIAALPTTAERTWEGRLSLCFGAREGRTVLAHRAHSGPLMVQSPFYPEPGVCHVYLLHPPGGVVGGDVLEVNVEVASDAHALVTTPAATKLYRSAGRYARVRQTLRLAAGASFEWLPQENILFDGARANMHTRIVLEDGARFLGWESWCLGRPASRELFSHGELRQDVELWVGKHPLVIERNRLQGASDTLSSAWGLGNHVAGATLLAYPGDPALAEEVRRHCARFSDGLLGVSLLDGLLSCRLLGHRMMSLKSMLETLWRALRPLLLQREASPPRIWAT